LEFLEHLAHPTEHFRHQIQHLLSEIWGYDHSVLWFTDESGNISYPHLYQIQDKVIFDYLANYDELDFLHPKKHLNNLSNQRVFCINDMVSFEQFEQSEFYKGFMKKHHYYDEMVVNLTYQKKLVGTLGLLRSKGEPPFGNKDVMRFKAISTFISQKFSSQIMLEDVEYQKKILEAHADKSLLGLIILDLCFRPLYYNKSASVITKDLLANENEKSMETFINKCLINQKNLRLGYVKSVLSPTFQQYTIQFDPKSDFQRESFYTIHLIPELYSNNTTRLVDLKLSFLTPREIEICDLVRAGSTNLQIAHQSFISINTVKRHLQNIFSKLEVKNRTGLIGKLDRL
jgi:DNA-binding CsgD family transcriptional regulator